MRPPFSPCGCKIQGRLLPRLLLDGFAKAPRFLDGLDGFSRTCRAASRKPYQSLSLRTVDHARRTARLYRAMLEKVAVSASDGRRRERRSRDNAATYVPVEVKNEFARFVRISFCRAFALSAPSYQLGIPARASLRRGRRFSAFPHSFVRALDRPRPRRIAGFLLDFYSTLHPLARAVLLDTPRPVEMDVSAFAASKMRALVDTYLEPCLLDTQTSKNRLRWLLRAVR
jgi:hypothetical protein